MPHPGIREELRTMACLDDAVGEVDILAEAHLRKTAQFLIDITTDTHVKRSGIELVELGLPASDSTRCKEGGHRVGDGFLDRGE